MSVTATPADPTSPPPVNTSSFDAQQTAYAVLGARDFGVAVLGGGLSMFVFQYGLSDAVRFGAICSLSSSLADTILSVGGLETKIKAYYDSYPMYFDLADLVMGGVVAGGLFYVVGQSSQDLMYSAGIAAVSCAVGPKISTAIITKQ